MRVLVISLLCVSVALGANRDVKESVCTKKWLQCIAERDESKASKITAKESKLASDIAESVTKVKKGSTVIDITEVEEKTNLVMDLTKTDGTCLNGLSRANRRLDQIQKVVEEGFKQMKTDIEKLMEKTNGASGYKTPLVQAEDITIINRNLKREYSVIVRRKTWYDARRHCQQNDSDLAMFETKAENDYMVQYIRSHIPLNMADRYWLGGGDFAREGRWKWDKESGARMTFKYFGYNEPNGGTTENCLDLLAKKNFKWNDESCMEKNFFICERALS